MPTLTFDQIEERAAAHHAAEAAKHTPKPSRRTVTLTPFGHALVLARQTGRAIATLQTADECLDVFAEVPSAALAAIRADAPPVCLNV